MKALVTKARSIDLFEVSIIAIAIVVIGSSLYSVVTGESLGSDVHYSTLGRIATAVILTISAVVFFRAYMGLRETRKKLKRLEQETEAAGDR